jgi:hypothetical protein
LKFSYYVNVIYVKIFSVDIKFIIDYLFNYFNFVMNFQNKKKRKGVAARLRDENKKKIIDTLFKCYSIEQMFTKKTQSTITVSKFSNFNAKICFY